MEKCWWFSNLMEFPSHSNRIHMVSWEAFCYELVIMVQCNRRATGLYIRRLYFIMALSLSITPFLWIYLLCALAYMRDKPLLELHGHSEKVSNALTGRAMNRWGYTPKVTGCQLLWAELCPLIIHTLSPNPQYLRMWPYLKIGL